MKFLLAWISVACSQQCSANTLIRFDNPYLLVELVGEKINGYYGLSSPEIDGRPSTSCEFFFTSDGAQTTKHDVVAIHTFYTNRTFNERDRGNLLAGEILRGRKEWTLQMAQVPFGCLSAAGGGFLEGSAVSNLIKKVTPIIGLFVVNRKTYFYEKKGFELMKKKSFVIPGNVVIAYNRFNALSIKAYTPDEWARDRKLNGF